MFKTRAVSDLNSFKNVPLVFYFNGILNNALKKEKAVKITNATRIKYYANRLNNPSSQPQGREGGRGRATHQSFIREGSAPWTNPLPAFIYHFWQKRYPLLRNNMPFTYRINAASFNCCKSLSFKYEILAKQYLKPENGTPCSALYGVPPPPRVTQFLKASICLRNTALQMKEISAVWW